LLLAFILFAAAEVVHVTVEAADSSVSSSLKLLDELGIAIVLIGADIEIVQNLVDGPASDATKAKILLEMPASMPFCNVVRYRDRGLRICGSRQNRSDRGN
jgi:hypothetical protein